MKRPQESELADWAHPLIRGGRFIWAAAPDFWSRRVKKTAWPAGIPKRRNAGERPARAKGGHCWCPLTLKATPPPGPFRSAQTGGKSHPPVVSVLH
ncbi:hypothetical protein VTN96DRAFT_10453 [Rasamsonia emersonii]